MDHEVFIRRCLDLAQQGRGFVGNGALVGSVLVHDGKIIAEGFHRAFGADHAEVDMIKKVDQKFPLESGLYVNLEPCCHQGKTPPCTHRVIHSGIKKVIFGMYDPDPRVAGKGIAELRAAGIEVIGPVLPVVCRRFNKGFVSVRENGRPYITLKQAFTKAGMIANPDGSRMQITNADQDAWSHTCLRATHDAVLVGVGTIECDDPELTVRLNKKSVPTSSASGGLRGAGQKFPQPYRLILDPDSRISPKAKVLTDAYKDRTILVTKNPTSFDGIRTMTVPVKKGRFDWQVLYEKLMTPEGDYHGITSILVEGGRRTWMAFKDAGMVDEDVILIGQ